MRKKIRLIAFSCSLITLLNSCNSVEKNSEQFENDKVNEITSICETSIFINDDDISSSFSGFTLSGNSIVTANTASSLNQNGLLYCDDSLIIFTDSNGDLVCQTDDNRYTIATEVNAKCINYADGNIYYIDSSKQNQVYCYNIMDNTGELYINENVSFFSKLNDCSLYEDNNHHLILLKNNTKEIISEKLVLWIDYFDDNIIYTELDGKSSEVKAYNLNSNKTITVLEYGFSPSVYKEYLYYQDKTGFIKRMNLVTGESEEFCNEWGQQMCFVDDKMYYLNSNGINHDGQLLYSPENKDFSVMNIFECNNEIYFTEGSNSKITLYKFNTNNYNKDMIE